MLDLKPGGILPAEGAERFDVNYEVMREVKDV